MHTVRRKQVERRYEVLQKRNDPLVRMASAEQVYNKIVNFYRKGPQTTRPRGRPKRPPATATATSTEATRDAEEAE